MKALKIAVQMDPLHSIDITGDSTFALMLEAQARGHKLWHYEVPHMWLDGARLKARVKPVTVQAVHGAHHEFGPESIIDLSDMDVVLMRQDPPFDMAYITATHMLEHIHPQDPGGEQPGFRAQRAGEAAGDAFPRADAPHPGLVGPRGHP